MEGHAPLAADAPDLRDRLHRSHLVVDVHDRDERGLVGDRRRDIGGIDQPVAIHRQVGDAVALVFELLAGAQHRVMLDGAGDDVLATPPWRIRDALDRQIISLGAAAGEDDLGGAAVQQPRDGLVGGVKRGEGFASQAIDAAGVAEELTEIWLHALEDARIERCRSGVVHIDDAIGQGHSRASSGMRRPAGCSRA